MCQAQNRIVPGQSLYDLTKKIHKRIKVNLKNNLIIAIISISLATFQSIGHSLEFNLSGLTSKDNPNRVTLKSYTVDIDDDHPAAADKWRDNPIDIEGVMSYPKDSESSPFPVIIYLNNALFFKTLTSLP